MKVTYSREADALMIALKPGAPVAANRRLGRDCIADFDAEGRLLGIEILDASQYLDPETLAGWPQPTQLLSLAEAAKESGLAAATLRVQLNHGRLKGVKRGRDWFVPVHELWTYLESRAPAGRPPRSRKAKRARTRAKAKVAE